MSDTQLSPSTVVSAIIKALGTAKKNTNVWLRLDGSLPNGRPIGRVWVTCHNNSVIDGGAFDGCTPAERCMAMLRTIARAQDGVDDDTPDDELPLDKLIGAEVQARFNEDSESKTGWNFVYAWPDNDEEGVADDLEGGSLGDLLGLKPATLADMAPDAEDVPDDLT